MLSYYQKNVYKLLRFDKIRIYKLIELFQYSFIFLVISIVLTRTIDGIFMEELTNDEDALSKKTTLWLHIELVILAFLYSIVSYYMQKFVFIIPSVMSLIDTSFRPHTTLHYSINIVFIVVFVQMSNSLTSRLKYLNYVQ